MAALKVFYLEKVNYELDKDTNGAVIQIARFIVEQYKKKSDIPKKKKE